MKSANLGSFWRSSIIFWYTKGTLDHFGVTSQLQYAYEGAFSENICFSNGFTEFGLTFGSGEVTLGLVWVYECYFRSF